MASIFNCHALEANDLDSFGVLFAGNLLVSPVKGPVISPFGRRNGKTHTGCDVKCQKGDTIVAACSGVVSMAKTYFGYGKLVVLKHVSTIETYYAHLDKLLVKVGDSIFTGQPVGLAGRTGRATTEHLHFELRKDKKPINPSVYFNFQNGLVLKSPTSKMEVTPSAPSIFIAQEPLPNPIKEETTETIESIIVQKGDTLYGLSKRYNTTVQQLQALNQLDGTFLKIGQQLKLR